MQDTLHDEYIIMTNALHAFFTSIKSVQLHTILGLVSQSEVFRIESKLALLHFSSVLWFKVKNEVGKSGTLQPEKETIASSAMFSLYNMP